MVFVDAEVVTDGARRPRREGAPGGVVVPHEGAHPLGDVVVAEGDPAVAIDVVADRGDLADL
jgi:hypothetical protein